MSEVVLEVAVREPDHKSSRGQGIPPSCLGIPASRRRKPPAPTEPSRHEPLAYPPLVLAEQHRRGARERIGRRFVEHSQDALAVDDRQREDLRLAVVAGLQLLRHVDEARLPGAAARARARPDRGSGCRRGASGERYTCSYWSNNVSERIHVGADPDRNRLRRTKPPTFGSAPSALPRFETSHAPWRRSPIEGLDKPPRSGRLEVEVRGGHGRRDRGKG